MPLRIQHARGGKVWRIGLPILALLAVVLAIGAPVAAQQRPDGSAGERSSAPRARLVAEFRSAPRAAAPRPAIELLPGSNRDADADGTKRSLVDKVRYTETPFVQEFWFPVSELWHGRLEVDGFSSDYSMENLLWGLPAAGNLPSWGVTLQSHVAISAPNQEGAFGLALSLHAAGEDGNNGCFHPREWLSWMMRTARG